MEYIHIKNLEKYHPGYKDRTLQWGKIYINMAEGDPDTELIENETDWARLVKMILLELRAQKPLPNTDVYWTRKGFDLKKRPMSLTLKMLHNFIDIVTENVENRYESVTQIRVREDKIKSEIVEVFNYFTLKTKKAFKLTPAGHKIILQRLEQGYNQEQLKKAIDNFVLDDWPERHKFLDLVYCLGNQKGKGDNFEKWLNFEPKITKLEGAAGILLNDRT